MVLSKMFHRGEGERRFFSRDIRSGMFPGQAETSAKSLPDFTFVLAVSMEIPYVHSLKPNLGVLKRPKNS